MESINVVGDMKNIFKENKVNYLNEVSKLKDINNKTDIEISNVLSQYNYSYKIINI